MILRAGMACILLSMALGAQATAPSPTDPAPHASEAARHAHLLADAVIEPVETPRPRARAVQPRPCATVFGYLPYWERPATLRYDLLTHLACFSIEVNQTGAITNRRGWPWTAEINAAHAAGVKVIVVITLFNDASLLTLLTTPAYRQNLMVNIRNEILAGNADGVNIDFEGGGAWRGHINGFMAELTAYLHEEIPGSEVSFAGPAVNWSNGFDLVGLANSCDAIFIMGYAFSGQWSTTSAPMAPLTGGSINITDTVLDEYDGVDRSKLILGVPYYGYHWTTTSSSARSTVISSIGSVFYRTAAAQVQTYGRQWDALSQTPWYRWHDGTNWHQVWYDDAESLGLKYQLAIDEGLQGVGIWALDYDSGRTELWDLLEEKFGGCYPCCDFNNDRQVNLFDFNTLRFCLQGPAFEFDAGHMCADADVDGDGDVDLADFHTFAQAFGK